MGGQGQSAQHSARACVSPISRRAECVGWFLPKLLEVTTRDGRKEVNNLNLNDISALILLIRFHDATSRSEALAAPALTKPLSSHVVNHCLCSAYFRNFQNLMMRIWIRHYTAGPKMLSVLPRSEQVTFMDPMRQYPSPEKKSKSGWSGWVPPDMESLQHSATFSKCSMVLGIQEFCPA